MIAAVLTAGEFTHLTAHTTIFFGHVAAMLLVPRAMATLIATHPVTYFSGMIWFFLGGITHMALALDHEEATLVTVAEHVQAVAIVVFMVFLLIDLQRAARQLRRAFVAIGVRHGSKLAREVQATIENAISRRPE